MIFTRLSSHFPDIRDCDSSILEFNISENSNMRTEFLASIIALNSLILEVFALHSQKLWPRKANAPSSGQSGSGCLENIKVLGGSCFFGLSEGRGLDLRTLPSFPGNSGFVCVACCSQDALVPLPPPRDPFYLLVQAALPHVKGPKAKLS